VLYAWVAEGCKSFENPLLVKTPKMTESGSNVQSAFDFPTPLVFQPLLFRNAAIKEM